MNVFKRHALTLSITFLMNGVSLLTAASATHLVFTAQPTNSAVGAQMSPVLVQLEINGTNLAQSGVTILLALNRTGLHGTTNVTTDATGKAAFTNLVVSVAGTGDKLTATSTNLGNATSSSFNVNKGSTTTALVSSTNLVIYGKGITLTAAVNVAAPATGAPGGLVTFKDGTVALGTASLNSAGIATFSTNRISAVNTNQILTATYGGDTNFLSSTSSNLIQNVGKLPLAVSGIIASNKIYDGTTKATLNFTNAALATVLTGDAVTLNFASAAGAFTDKAAGTAKTVLVNGLTLAGASAGNYSLLPAAATASILPRSLVITAKGVNKVYDGTANAAVTLTDNRLAGDIFTNGYAAAAFTSKNVGTNILVNVNGLFIGGTNAGNYSLSNLNTTTTANITPATVTISGIVASNKVYDATTTASLNFSNAQLATVFIGDTASLNTAVAKGAFATKNVGTGKTVQISGLTLTGTNAGNYLLVQPSTTASITPRAITLAAKGANKVYDSTTNATVTLTDNRLSGDALTDSYASASFTNKNVGTNILINVLGLAIAGTDSTNYILTATNTTASANITKFPLTVAGGVANNKIYDRTATATLNFSNAALVTVFSGDSVVLNTNSAKAVFPGKTVGTNLTVTISGLALAGVSSNNYSLIQPTATASILPRGLTITAKGANKIYDGTTNAAVTLTDNRVAGDLLTNSYAFAAFTNKNVATNILINVYGLATIGPDAANYFLTATNATATASISPALLTVAAASLSRPYATTNPVLFAIYSGFVTNESLTNSDVTGSPVLTTTAKTNSSVGVYSITITKGTLASVDYSFKFTNGVLTVTKADTAALLTTTLNPALTNQIVTFAATVSPVTATVLPPTGVVQFRCNGTNKLGNAINLASGKANFTVVAAALGMTNTVITAEYSDPAGNFNSSTNSLIQSVVAVVTPPPPSKLSLVPSAAGGALTGQLSGVSGQTYIIQASTDLLNWIPLSTNIADINGIVSLVDSNAVAYPSRYYRAFSP